MGRILFSKNMGGYYLGITEWYRDNLLYVLIKENNKEKAFLVKLTTPRKVTDYADSIGNYLRHREEIRNGDGSLAITELTLPKIGLIL